MEKHLPTETDAPLHMRLALPANFTSDDLAFLPDSEVKALRAAGVLDDLKEQAADDQAKAADDPAKEAPAPEAEPGEAAKQEVKPQEQPAKVEQPAAILDASDDFDVSKLKPLPDVAAAKADLTKVDADIADLKKKYDDMDIDQAEYDKQFEAFVERKAEARFTLRQADAIMAENQKAFADHWYSTVNTYMDANPGLKDPSVLPLFDAALRKINSDPSSAVLPPKTRIAMAHMDLARIAPQVAAAQPKPAEQKKPGTTGPRTEPRPDPVTTLAQVPASAGNDVDNSEFAAIDRAPNPYASEAAFSTLSPEAQARFLAQA